MRKVKVFFFQTPIFLSADNLILEKSDRYEKFQTHVFHETFVIEKGLDYRGCFGYNLQLVGT